MTSETGQALKFGIGAHAFQHVPLSLGDALRGVLPQLPPLAREAPGYALTSLPETMVEGAVAASGKMLPFIRRHAVRRYVDLGIGFDAWFAALARQLRDELRGKARRIAGECGGDLDVRSFRTPAEIAAFHDHALRISQRSYRWRLPGWTLPDTAEFAAEMQDLAAADRVRAWLLYVAGEPAAFLYCPAPDGSVVLGHSGHDPAFRDWSPGAVLRLEALQELFDEGRFAHLDLGEGVRRNERALATGELECVDLLLLRPSLADRLTIAALDGFRRAVRLGFARKRR
jgi:hypothetical protein